MNFTKPPLADFRSFAARPEAATSRIVSALAIRGEATAAELVADTQLSRSSVSSLLAELRASDVVLDLRHEPGGVGRPTLLHSLNPDLGICAGALLGHGEIHLCICDVTHQVLSEEIFLLDPNYSPDFAARVVAELLAKHCDMIGKSFSDLIGVGLAISAPIARDGFVVYSSILPSWAGVSIAEVFGAQLGCPVHVDNESHCAAFAEMTWGVARGEPDFAMFKFDLGVGGAVVIDGVLRQGSCGMGGEFGHIPLDPNGPLCLCGNRGCLDALVGVRHILRLVKESTGEAIDVNEFTQKACDGHVAYLRLLEDAADAAGRGLGVVSNILNPPLFVITGGLAQAGEAFLAPLKRSFERHSMSAPGRVSPDQTARVIAGQFLENDNVLGAAALVLRQVARVY